MNIVFCITNDALQQWDFAHPLKAQKLPDTSYAFGHDENTLKGEGNLVLYFFKNWYKTIKMTK